MQEIVVSVHATRRYRERFAGNLSWSAARQRLYRLLGRARFRGMRPGQARLYALGEMRFIVEQDVLVTVYRQTYQDMPPSEDLWCLAS